MKTDSIKLLSTAVQYLDILAQGGSVNISDAKFCAQEALSAIRSAIYLETPHTSRRFDIYQFVSKDKNRPALTGVYFDRGNKVASDSHILVALKESYDSSLEGRIIDRQGKDVTDCKYPTWEVLFPKEKGQCHTINTASVYELQRRVKAERRATGGGRVGGWKRGPRGFVKVGDTFFDSDNFALLCKFMDAYGATDIETFGPRRAAVVIAPDGSRALIMPVYYVTYTDKFGNYHGDAVVSDMFKEDKDCALWYEAA